MDNLNIRIYNPDDQSAVIDLWAQCGLLVPWNNPRQDIARKLADSPELFFVGEIGSDLVAACMAGYDGHRGWIYYLGVRPDLQRRGIAARMVEHAEGRLRELGCPKINLMVRKRNDAVISFYKHIGYGDDPVSVLSKRLNDDDAYGV